MTGRPLLLNLCAFQLSTPYAILPGVSAALLGDAKFREWQEYRDSAGARMLVRQLRAVLDEASDPLVEYQIPFLTKAIAEAQQRYGSESQYYDTNFAAPNPKNASWRAAAINHTIERTEEYNRYLTDAASPYLSAGPLERLEEMLDQQLEGGRAYRNTARE